MQNFKIIEASETKVSETKSTIQLNLDSAEDEIQIELNLNLKSPSVKEKQDQQVFADLKRLCASYSSVEDLVGLEFNSDLNEGILKGVEPLSGWGEVVDDPRRIPSYEEQLMYFNYRNPDFELSAEINGVEEESEIFYTEEEVES